PLLLCASVRVLRDARTSTIVEVKPIRPGTSIAPPTDTGPARPSPRSGTAPQVCDPVRVPEQVLPRVRAAVLGAVGLPLAGVVAVLLAAAWAGRLAPDSVVDPGTVVRVASPVVTVLGELAVAVTLGALALTAFV